jgi:hypothetical protein
MVVAFLSLIFVEHVTYGAVLRGIRGFYFNLRRKLGEKKASDKIKSLKNIEFLQVNHELHKISKTMLKKQKGRMP